MMALSDDHRFLLSHVHHSFVTCDDTGMCEMAMLIDVVTDKAPLFSCGEKILNYYSDTVLLEAVEGQSYDLTSGIGFIGNHRHRSNTAQRLERLRKEKQMQAEIAHIHWKEFQSHLSDKELRELFPKKDVPLVRCVETCKKSTLSEALELFPSIMNNPFSEYARFDGRINRNLVSKRILIYLTMLPSSERSYGMEVVCLSSARVQELIGLICWMYTCEGREPKLQLPVYNYCLKIAEETGEVDEDFPNLDGNEFVGKFGFPFLALIKKEDGMLSSSQVAVYIKDEIANVPIPSLDITLREVANLVSQKVSVRESKAYHMEKLEEPGIPIPLDSKLFNYSNLDFRLVFEEDIRDHGKREFGTEEYDSHMRTVEAPLYRSYNVSYCQKMGLNYDAQLGISGEKVEINPLPPKGAAKLLTRTQKPTTCYMDSIVACEIITKRYSPGKCIFKLVHHTGSEFRKYLFETDPQTARDIVKKVQAILEMHSSHACKEYEMYKGKKLQRESQKSRQLLLRP